MLFSAEYPQQPGTQLMQYTRLEKLACVTVLIIPFLLTIGYNCRLRLVHVIPEDTFTDGAAFWTAVLVLVGILQSLVLFLQLRYVRRSLDEGRKASAVAAETAQATVDAIRPWIKIELNLVGKLEEHSTTSLRLKHALVLTNLGKSPATNISCGIFMANSPSRFSALELLIHATGNVVYPGETFVVEDVYGRISFDQLQESAEETLMGGHADLYTKAVVKYDYVGGDGESNVMRHLRGHAAMNYVRYTSLDGELFYARQPISQTAS